MIGKPKRNGMREVFVYDPKLKRKVYCGQRPTLREARALELAKKQEFAGERDAGWTIDAFAAKFLDDYHGPRTTRPEPTTRKANEQNLRRIRREHGDRLLASLTRDEAYLLGVERPHEAKPIAAMYAAAVDKGFVQVNPFARLGLPRGRGRNDIDPLTLEEVEELAAIAIRTLGFWGPEFAALIRWMGWTGERPGEVCGHDATDIDWTDLTVSVERNRRNDGTLGPVKGKERRTIPLADEAAAAVLPLKRTHGELFLSPTRKPLRPNSLRHYWLPVRAAFTAQLDPTHWLRVRLTVNPKAQLVPYELRHHCGSMLADRGLSSDDIGDYLGNTAAVCEATYIHPYRDRQFARLREALNRPLGDDEHRDGQAARQETS